MWLLPLALATGIQADLHLDTPTQLHRRGVGLDGMGLESAIQAMQVGGTNVAVEVLWPPNAAGGPQHVDTLFTRVEAEDARLSTVTLTRTPAEARDVANAGGIALVVALEGAHGLGDLGALHRRGLTMLGLTWSFSNRYAGSSGDDGGGLTPDGERLVAEAQGMGVLVDISHASRTATLDTCRVARAPIVASHSDAAAVADVPRNLTDPEIRCIAETGGVIGVNLHSAFLGPPASAARAADHFDHLRRIGGIGVVALGSDFDGIIQPPRDVPTAAELPRIWEELSRRGWAEWEIELARGENFLRAWAAARSIAGL